GSSARDHPPTTPPGAFRTPPSGDLKDLSAGSRKLAFHLRGTVPRGARTFTWSHDMPLGSYLLRTLNEGDPEPTNQWLDSGRTSRPFALRHVTPPLGRAEVIRVYL